MQNGCTLKKEGFTLKMRAEPKIKYFLDEHRGGILWYRGVMSVDGVRIVSAIRLEDGHPPLEELRQTLKERILKKYHED